jgi:molybdopterin molybdotransferase
MKGFRTRAEVADVQALLAERVQALPPGECDTLTAYGQLLAQPVTSPVDLPGFDRAAMDGYAVRGEDTFGATELAPLTLKVIGTSLPGKAFHGTVAAGLCVRIMTGAPMPKGADAVLMAEEAQAERDVVRIIASVSPQKNVSAKGEDVRRGEVLLEAGRVLRPQDIGILSAAGVPSVIVCNAPNVDIIITGNEILPPGSVPEGHQIVDSNGPMLDALVFRDGGHVVSNEIVRDDREELTRAISAAKGHVVIISGGSSVGEEDFAPEVVSMLGELDIHGIAMRPSSPTGVGFLDQRRPVFLLPGNPVSCLCAYDFFTGPTIRALAGRPREMPYRTIALPLARKLTSQAGRVDYARVKVFDGKVEPLMVSGAGILSSTVKADGFVIVERDLEGIEAGATVTVHLYG